MKKLIILLCIVASCATLLSQGLTDVKIYVNPGHGGFTNDDRNIATPGHPTSGHPLPTWDDETGFWESQSNLDKGFYLRDRLLERGANVKMSRVTNTQADDVSMTALAGDADSFGADVFISIHSNASNGNANFLFLMYRDGVPNTPTSIAMARHCFPFMVDNPLDSYTAYYPYNPGNVKVETNALGVQNSMTIAGFLSEGSFHDYVPEACRLLNMDYKHLEAIRMFRYFVDYYEDVPETTGTLAGYVKTQDEKMQTVFGALSFTYHGASDDQWRPLNGATVKLLDASGATTIDTYTVDDEYNGIFVFYDLEPGNYKLEASFEGYVSQTVDVSVTAAKTSNQKIFLRDVNFVEPEPDPANYPDPKPDVIAEELDFGEFSQQGTILQEPWLNANNIKRALYRNDKLYVLSNVETSPKISIYDATDLSFVKDMDLTGVSGGQVAISDIAFTSDDKLLACNRQLIAMPENSGRLFKVYIWDDDDAVPELYFEMAGYAGANFSQGLVGETMAVSGASWNSTMYLPVISRLTENTGSWNVVRFISISKETDGAPIASFFGKAPTDQSTLYTLSKLGSDFQITISPRADDYFILTSSEMLPTELQLNKEYANVGFPGGIDANSSSDIAITRIGVFAEKDGYDLFKTNGANYFRYAGRSYMAAPVAQAGRVSAGVVLFDITDGLDNAVKISEQFPEAGLGTTAAPYMAAFGTSYIDKFDFSVLAENQGYARFSAVVNQMHTVTFDSKGGSNVPNVYVTHGEKLSKPADPILEGYALEGWYVNEGELWVIDTESGVNFRDAPSTSGNIIPVGGIPNGTQVVVTEKVTDPTYVWGKTVYNGYTGWFVTGFANLISEQVFEWDFDNDVVTDDMTLEAHWTSGVVLEEFTVTFNLNYTGSPEPSTATVDDGKTVSQPSNPYREGYTFEGWFTEAACTNEFLFTTPVTADLDLYANWAIFDLDITPNTAWYTADPDAEVFYIGTAQELAGLAQLVNNSPAPGLDGINFLDKTIELTADIDLSIYGSNANGGCGWIRIGHSYGTPEYIFQGTFDGKGYTISNMYYRFPGYPTPPDVPATAAQHGLFGYVVEPGIIRNVRLVNIDLEVNSPGGTAGTRTGGLVGWLYGDGLIERAYVQGTVKFFNATYPDNVGGILGGIGFTGTAGGTIRNCHANVNVMSVGAWVGGIAGGLGNGSGVMENCYATGAVSGANYVGGLVGNNQSGTNQIKNSVAINTNLKSAGSNVGRVTGSNVGTLENNAGLTTMTTDGGSDFPAGQNTDSGLNGEDITMEEILADGTIGGRFTTENEWIVREGKLPLLFPGLYSVTFNTDGGTPVPALQYVSEGGKATEPATEPAKSGYLFLGWFLGENEYDFDSELYDDIVLVAKWEIIKAEFDVSFATDGGAPVPDVQKVLDGETATRPATDPTREGYIFDGWFTETDDEWNFDTDVITGHTTLYAKWTKNSYTVTFNSHGGSTIEAVSVEHGDKLTKPADPTQDDYTFKGWFTEAAYTNEWTFDTDVVTSDLILHAKWEAINKTGYEIAEISLLRIYPNPTDGVLILEFEEAGAYVVTLADMSGKKLISQQVSEQVVHFDISDVPNGVYLLLISDGERQTVTRVVKQ